MKRSSDSAWIPNHSQTDESADSMVVLPDFDPSWREEFLKAISHPRLYVFRFMMAMFSTFVLLGLLGAWTREDGKRGGVKWFALVYSGYAACVLISWVLLVICAIPGLQPFARRNRDLLSSVWVTVSFLGVVSTSALTETRRAVFNMRESTYSDEWFFQNISYNMTQHRIQCTDTDEEYTLMTWDKAEEPGCAFKIVYGTVPVLFLSAFMCMSTLKMGLRAATSMLLASVAGWAAIIVMTGHHGFSVWITLFLMAIAGPTDLVQCHLKREDEKHEFVTRKATNFASNRQRQLLGTLMPPNVLEAVTRHEEASVHSEQQGILCGSVKHGTVLFCAWELAVESVAGFSELSSLIDSMDAAVEQSGMYKYQVSDSRKQIVLRF